jgi:hypothetical protein
MRREDLVGVDVQVGFKKVQHCTREGNIIRANVIARLAAISTVVRVVNAIRIDNEEP